MNSRFIHEHKNHFIAFVISLSVFLVLSFFYTQTRILDGLENGAVNFRFFLRDPSEKAKKLQEGVRITKKNPRSRDDIIILGIDENTIREFTGQKIHWPFPWDIHAKFTRYVATGNPKAIFFDIMFLDHKKHEQEFADAIREAGCVFLDFPFETEEVDVKYADTEDRMSILNRLRFRSTPEDTSYEWAEEAVPPTPTLAGAAKGIGYANIRPDPDSINRKLPIVIKHKGFYYPSIDLVLDNALFRNRAKDVEIKNGSVRPAHEPARGKNEEANPQRELRIPIDREGFMDIKFIGGPGSFQNYPYYYFYNDGKITNKSLENKIVFVAAYSVTGISTDIHKSPYGDLFGIEHHANALNTILNQDFNHQADRVGKIVILLLIAVAMGLFVPKFSILMSIIFSAGLGLVYIVAAYLLFDTMNILYIFCDTHHSDRRRLHADNRVQGYERTAREEIHQADILQIRI
jgi:adenylate cyclase